MLIGVLEAETLSGEVRQHFGSYGEMFAALLRPLSGSLAFRYYAADQGELPTNIGDCDAYIVTGSRHNAYDRDPWIESLKAFVRQLHENKRKCLGICFGHQVIAQALGGHAGKSDKGWGVGLKYFDVASRPAWMREPAARFAVLVSHQDQVHAPPPEATRFASSAFCPNGGYYIAEHIFCLQGHPEFSRDYLRFLLDKRRRAIGEARSDAARESLGTGADQDLLQAWLDDFLTLQK